MRIALLNIFYTIPLLINAGCESIPFKNQSTSIPFHLHDNRIMIPVIVNGRGPYNFVFDTGGARAHTMNLSLAKELDLDLDASKDQSGAGEKSQKTWSTMVSSYSISELNLKNQKFDVIDLSAIQKAFNFERLDGIIGYDVLQRSITCINFEKQILFLKNGKADCFDTNGITVPFRLDHDTPIISGEVNGIKTEFFIDTGDRSALSLFQKFAVKNGLENLFKNEKEIMTGMGVGGPIPGRIKSLDSVSLGPIKLQNVVSRLPSTKAGYFARSPLGGSLGNEVLRRFNLILDYSKNEITFFKNSKFDDPYQFVPPISDKKF